MDWILNEPKIPERNQRMHMAYSLCRMYMKLADHNHIPLQRTDTSTTPHQMRSLEMDGENIVLNQEVLDTGVPGRKLKKTVLFDYNKLFDASQNRESLKNGIFDTIKEITVVMDKVHQNYKDSMTRKWFAKEKVDYRMNIGFWRHPFKYLTNKKGEKNFDFETSDTINEKQISLTFHNNKFQIKLDGEDYPKKPTKSLPKILNTRAKGSTKDDVKFVFQGLEGGIEAMINKKVAEQLRKNRKIEHSVVAAKDPITNRIYFMEAGSEMKLSYVEGYDIAQATGAYAYNYAADLKNGRFGILKGGNI
jgi:hypothetical protein